MEDIIKAGEELSVFIHTPYGWARAKTVNEAVKNYLKHNSHHKKSDFLRDLMNGNVDIYVTNAEKLRYTDRSVFLDENEHGKVLIHLGNEWNVAKAYGLNNQ